jgi:hypothetical protein
MAEESGQKEDRPDQRENFCFCGPESLAEVARKMAKQGQYEWPHRNAVARLYFRRPPKGGYVMSTRIRAIKGDNITLDFDGVVVSPETLRQAVSGFVELLCEISSEVAGSGKTPKWNIEVDKGSAVFIARPIADNLTQRASVETIDAITSGLRMLERGPSATPPFFNDRALKAARSLGSLTEGKQKRLTYLRVRSKGKPCEITPRASVSADLLIAGQHTAYGHVEGKLQTLSERGQLQIVVYDDLFDKGVNCFIDNEHAQAAIGAFGKRVSVGGMVKRDSEGRPLSIKVESIRVFKGPTELPPFDELQGIYAKAG